jgi:hypothetical protein
MMRHYLPGDTDHFDLAAVGLPPVGATLMVAAGDAPVATVVVERTLDDHVVAVCDGVRVPSGGAVVRWFDPAQPSLEASAAITATDDTTRLHLRLLSAWRDVDARRSQRFEARYPMPAHVLQTVENKLVPNLRLGLVCIDLSTTGMRAAYHGRPPGIGELLEIAMGTAGIAAKRVMARVTRVDAFAFGRSEIGLTFVFDSESERRHVLAVRDHLAAAGALRGTSVA